MVVCLYSLPWFCLSPYGSWDRLQLPGDPDEDTVENRWEGVKSVVTAAHS